MNVQEKSEVFMSGRKMHNGARIDKNVSGAYISFVAYHMLSLFINKMKVCFNLSPLAFIYDTTSRYIKYTRNALDDALFFVVL